MVVVDAAKVAGLERLATAEVGTPCEPFTGGGSCERYLLSRDLGRAALGSYWATCSREE